MKEYQKIKISLQKVTLQIGLKKFLWLEKLKILFCGHLLLVILMMKKLLERFMKRNCKKTNQREKWNLEWKKLLKKSNKLYVKWKVYDNSFNSWIDKKDIVI